jgi:hypothetical protein
VNGFCSVVEAGTLQIAVAEKRDGRWRSVPVFPVPFLRPGPVPFLALVLRLGASPLRLGGRPRGLRLMLLFRLHAWRLRRRLHGLLPGGLPLGLGLGTLRLPWLLRLRHARLWTLLLLLLLLLLLRPRRWGRRWRLLLELLPAYSLTGLVAIVAGANRPLLLDVPGIART